MITPDLDILQNIINHIDKWVDIFMLQSTASPIYHYLRKGQLDIYCHDSLKQWGKNEYEIINFLEYYPKTRNLYLEGNYMINRNMIDNIFVTKLGNIYKLDYWYNKNILRKLDIYLPNLYHLSVSGDNSITDDILHYIPNLKYLYLPSNEIITDNGISKLIKLEYLNFENNKQITNNGISELKQLKTLILLNNPYLSDSGLYQLTKLEILDIYWNTNITSQIFQNLDIKFLKIRKNIFNTLDSFYNIKNIKKLHICDGNKITDRDIIILSYLEDLCLEKNNLLTDLILFSLDNLKNLTLFENTLITNKGILYTNKLERIFLQSNTLITQDVIGQLPYLKVIHTRNINLLKKNN